MSIISIIIIIPLSVTSVLSLMKCAFFLPKEEIKRRKIYYWVSFATIYIAFAVLIVDLILRE